MYTELHDDHTEKKILALLCTKPTYLKALELDVELFQVPENIALASLFISYIKKYQTPPTEDALKGFIKDIKSINFSHINKIFSQSSSAERGFVD